MSVHSDVSSCNAVGSGPINAEDVIDIASSSDEEAEQQEWLCYTLLSHTGKHTYVGATCNLSRRVRQHNGEITGGAKATQSQRPWEAPSSKLS